MGRRLRERVKSALSAFAHATTEKGYVRYQLSTSGKEYEHRAVARIAWGPRVKWNPHFHVHHMDGNRSHNCRGNLLILPGCLHFANSNRSKTKWQ